MTSTLSPWPRNTAQELAAVVEEHLDQGVLVGPVAASEVSHPRLKIGDFAVHLQHVGGDAGLQHIIKVGALAGQAGDFLRPGDTGRGQRQKTSRKQ